METGGSRQLISVRMQGGLGNQLFEFAAALHLRDNLGQSVLLDTTSYHRRHVHGEGPTPRRYELRDFAHDFLELRRRTGRRSSPRQIARLIRRVARTRGADVLRLEEIIDGRASGPDRLSDPLLRSLELPWMQSASLALAVRRGFAERLERTAPDALSVDTAAPYVGVHCRLGDYVGGPLSSILGATEPTPVIELARQQSARHGDLPIRIFTDSPGDLLRWCAPELLESCQFDTSSQPWEVLTGLARASALVIANSTLSWWAAFISTQIAGNRVEVLRPVPWNNLPSRHDTELAVDGWVSYERELFGQLD